MAFGITRVNGSLIAPKNFAGVSLEDYTLTFWAGDTAAAVVDYNGGNGTPTGALDQIFRTAVGTVGTVSRVGTLNTATGAIRFALEVLGGDADSPGFLGGTPANNVTTAAALQTAVQALGTVTFTAVGTTSSFTVHCSSATIASFVY
jgi:hypothetical protein